MKRLAAEITPQADTEYYSTSLNDRCGFVIVKEGTRRLLWITVNGKLEFFTCSSLTQVFGILERYDIVAGFARVWDEEDGVGEPFEEMWQSVLADVREQCGKWEQEGEPLEPVPERVKKQLLWAFDASGKLDGDRFTIILEHESVQLTPAQMVELASEMTARPRFWDQVHPN